jgi:hypothetical protein
MQSISLGLFYPEVLSICGFIQSLRSIFNPEIFHQGGFAMLGKKLLEGDHLWLQYDSLILFSAIFSIMMLTKFPFRLSFGRPSNYTVSFAVFTYRLSTIASAIVSLLFIVQRYQLLLILIVLTIFAIRALKSSLGNISIVKKSLPSVLMISLLSIYFISLILHSNIISTVSAFFVNTYSTAHAKSLSQSGIFYKFTEVRTLFSSANIYHVIFGRGLGSLYFNAELARNVRFTHNIFTYVYLKFGLLGIIAGGFAFTPTVINAFKSIHSSLANIQGSKRPYFCSLIFSAKIASMASISLCLLQPSYKVYSFPFVLAMFLS